MSRIDRPALALPFAGPSHRSSHAHARHPRRAPWWPIVALGAGFLSFGLGACESDSGCKDDFDCKGALVCKVSTGVCEAFVCADDLDCQNGLSCNDNACE